MKAESAKSPCTALHGIRPTTPGVHCESNCSSVLQPNTVRAFMAPWLPNQVLLISAPNRCESVKSVGGLLSAPLTSCSLEPVACSQFPLNCESCKLPSHLIPVEIANSQCSKAFRKST